MRHSYLFIIAIMLAVMTPRIVEKPRDFDPFGQTGLSPLATI